MTLDEQLDAFDELAGRAFEMVVDDLTNNYTRIRDMARQRIIAGFDEYGDTMWKWRPETLFQEGLEELADAVNYKVPLMHQIIERGKSRPQVAA